jgi:hypothetical protein
MRVLLLTIALFGACLSQAEQACVDEATAPKTTPTARFVVNSDGTVLDTKTGLMWQTCEFGQSYDPQNKSCNSAALQVDWQQALMAAKNSEYAGYKDWQVPNIKELASIVEHACVEPSIDLNVFLSTQNDNYWTSTTAITQVDHAWAYQFADGKNNLKAKTSDIFLRLVRYAK